MQAAARALHSAFAVLHAPATPATVLLQPCDSTVAFHYPPRRCVCGAGRRLGLRPRPARAHVPTTQKPAASRAARRTCSASTESGTCRCACMSMSARTAVAAARVTRTARRSSAAGQRTRQLQQRPARVHLHLHSSEPISVTRLMVRSCRRGAARAMLLGTATTGCISNLLISDSIAPVLLAPRSHPPRMSQGASGGVHTHRSGHVHYVRGACAWGRCTTWPGSARGLAPLQTQGCRPRQCSVGP